MKQLGMTTNGIKQIKAVLSVIAVLVLFLVTAPFVAIAAINIVADKNIKYTVENALKIDYEIGLILNGKGSMEKN
jgi:hypothetical protein